MTLLRVPRALTITAIALLINATSSAMMCMNVQQQQRKRVEKKSINSKLCNRKLIVRPLHHDRYLTQS